MTKKTQVNKRRRVKEERFNKAIDSHILDFKDKALEPKKRSSKDNSSPVCNHAKEDHVFECMAAMGHELWRCRKCDLWLYYDHETGELIKNNDTWIRFEPLI